MTRRTRPAMRGMTLIELIVGMGVITVIFLGLSYVFHQAVMTHNIGIAQAEIHQQARAVFDYLGRELSGIPRDGRLVLASPGGAFDTWNVTVHSDVITFTTITPLPVRESDVDTDDLVYNNCAAVCYFRWLPSSGAPPSQQILYRLMDRLDTGQTIGALGAGRVVAPIDGPHERDQLALRVIRPLPGGFGPVGGPGGAFEVDYYDTATGTFLPVDGNDTYDSATRGLPRAIRVTLRCWDHGMHVRDERTGWRGLAFREVFRISAAD